MMGYDLPRVFRKRQKGREMQARAHSLGDEQLERSAEQLSPCFVFVSMFLSTNTLSV